MQGYPLFMRLSCVFALLSRKAKSTLHKSFTKVLLDVIDSDAGQLKRVWANEIRPRF
jgi:hypothetical protein